MSYLNLDGLTRYNAGIKSKYLLKVFVANNLTTAAAGYALDARQGKALKALIDANAAPFTHAKSGTVHTFTGTGSMGYAVLTATYASGNTFKVNSTTITAVIGSPEKFEVGGSVLFSVVGTKLYLYDTATLKSLPVYTYTGTSTFINDGNGDWRLKLLTSGTLKFTDRARDLDVFLVGGGGAGNSVRFSGGGGGGYTKTVRTTAAVASYAIVIGAGGNASDGGITSAFGVSANGGKAGQTYPGGNGGSGGGAYNAYTTGAGGSDGAAGGNTVDKGTTIVRYGGTGQGVTTREFGEAGRDLYAGGGGGGLAITATVGGAAGAGGGGKGGTTSVAATSGTANTGGGGGGSGREDAGASGGKGGSGIVIIRNHRG